MDHGEMDHSSTMSLPDVIELPASEGLPDTGAAPDLDDADDVVEVELEASEAEIEIAPGRQLRMWTYNESLPGPRIEAKVGDTVRVRFRNSLPQETTIHWHGLRVPNAMDGVARVQTPIGPGEEFTYEFVVPDAGTFWYHPHVRSDEQVERGLYGSIVVRGADEPETTSERVVVLDDVLIDPSTWQLAAFDEMMQGMVGRQGNVILANGRAHPIAEVRPGGLHRFRFINASNARYFRLALPGSSFSLIGTDGGLLEAARDVDEILLVPGQRADVLVAADSAETRTWKTLPYDRGHGTGALPAAAVFDLRPTTEDAAPTPLVPEVLATIDALPEPTVERRLELEESDGRWALRPSGRDRYGTGLLDQRLRLSGCRGLSGRPRCRRGMGNRQHHRDGSPVPSPWLSIPGDVRGWGRARFSRVAGYHQRSRGNDHALPRSARRESGDLDVSLPHLGARRARDDG